MKSCVACGMPMEKREDFAMQDESKDYCRYCARPDGSMQDYPEKLASMRSFIVRTQGLSEQAALEAARQMLSRLPAWKGMSDRN